MPIRIRILLVALVAVIAVGSTFYREYAINHNAVRTLEAERSAIRDDMALSLVIHELQRERGLSAGYMVDRSMEHEQMLIAQRRETDNTLASPPVRARCTAAWCTKLDAALRDVRRGVDSGTASWTHVRDSYTGAITRLLDAIAHKGHGAWAYAGGVPLYPVNDLAVARENLGLARATLYRIYSRNGAEPSERVALAVYYGAYSENLRLFMRDIGVRDMNTYSTHVSPELRQHILDQVSTVLADNTALSGSHPDSVAWWSDATRLIDQLKLIETGIYATKLTAINQLITARREALLRYAIFAIASTLVVSVLAFFAVARILTALSILLQALHTVMEKEDFRVRIPSGARDEFERIGTSLNALLTYTDTIITQKDLLASTDLLTNLNNRRRFLELVTREFMRAERYGNTPTVILCDIDRFKTINDRFGHAAGDTVLQTFASLLRENVRDSDVVGRWGGEEFVIMVPDGDVASAQHLAEKLRRKTEQLEIAGVGHITASFGLAARAAGEAFENLLQQADEALYGAKQQGRNRVCAGAAV